MSYYDYTVENGEVVSMTITDPVALQLFKVGDVHDINFSTCPEADGKWKVVSIEGSEVKFERTKRVIKSVWSPGITSVRYPKSKKNESK